MSVSSATIPGRSPNPHSILTRAFRHFRHYRDRKRTFNETLKLILAKNRGWWGSLPASLRCESVFLVPAGVEIDVEEIKGMDFFYQDVVFLVRFSNMLEIIWAEVN